MSDHDPDEILNIALTSDETRILAHGLHSWSGPGQPSISLARAIGYRGIDDLLRGGSALADALKSGTTNLSRRDWTRAIMSLEISFGSDAGAGVDWPLVSGFSDEVSIRLIRALQIKLVGARLRREEAFPLD